ncbi:MRC1-like domain-containing protein [Xylariales sp. PMI_506]|nr:MRC1-like domain-containing protein [Xylariales sp. PMI_506]
MASLRSPSPGSDASAPSSPQLSPRSKLRAEMAALDESSDEDSSRPIDAKKLFQSMDRALASSNEQARQDSGDDDESDDDIIRPRGRLAARMQADDSHKEKIPSPKPARAISTKVGLSNDSSRDSNPNKNDEADEEDEDEGIAVNSRRRRVPPHRSTTPEATAERLSSPASPGLFVSPSTSHHPAIDMESENDLPEDLGKNSRFQALVARKRADRLAREAEEEKKRDERIARIAEEFSDEADDDISDISDDDGGRKLTQEVTSRPAARKASKKALEEMNRETQRLSRSLQLAHEVKTKKKISKSALFEKFNFKPAGAPSPNEVNLNSSSRPTTPISASHTDAEMADAGTPPSSPPSASKKLLNLATTVAPPPEQDIIPDHPDQETSKSDKGKGKASLADEQPPQPRVVPAKQKRQMRVKLSPLQANMLTIDSDDELEIMDPRKQSKIDAILNRMPAKQSNESRAMQTFRQLAHVSSPPQKARGRSNQKPSITVGELQLNLQQRARAQAKLERERRLELLKAKGIHVQTEEEREKEREEVEDIVARARQEVEEIMAREREDAKKARKERKENGEEDGLDWEDSDDDSFAGTEEDEELAVIEQGEIEFSGSEDEDGDEEGDDSETPLNPLFDEQAEDSEEEEAGLSEDDETDQVQPSKAKTRRGKKHTQVISDDEEDAQVEATPKPQRTLPKSPSAPNTDSPNAPTSVLRSATKTFIPGLPIPAAGPAGLGLTQIFAGTMDDSQGGLGSGSPVQFLPSFNNFPDSQFSAMVGASQPADDMVLDSQVQTQNLTQGVQLEFQQSQVDSFDSLMQQMDNTQASDQVNPTQDAGFAAYTPLKRRFIDAPQSTVDTVLLPQSPGDQIDSPLVHKRGKLRLRGEVSFAQSTMPGTDIPGSPPNHGAKDTPANDADDDGVSAFRLMAKAARKKKRALEKFNKKKSKANAMVEEQAEESEDEYAGLGGADGEDSSDDEGLQELRMQMIDDKEGNDGDEDKLAAFFADRERAEDSAQVDKLFRDITTGMLRKRRRGGGGNGDFDLSDSDDGGEARRRMKRRQFAKMQKALFADERIGKIAENPRNAAFMKSIEDRDSDEEWTIEENIELEVIEESQVSQAEGEDRIPDSQPQAQQPDGNMGRKRSRFNDHAARPDPQVRRGGVRPASLVDVRRSLSSLLGEPNLSAESVIPATNPDESGSEGEDEQPANSDKENRRPAVVDRISLKRSGSSHVSNSRLAFAAPAATSTSSGTFKVPALLRRATTNSLMSQASSTSTSTTGSATTTTASTAGGPHRSAGFGDEAKLKKGAGKRSGINYFARENERREKLKESEKRREEKKLRRGVQGRGQAVSGLFGGGVFE